MPLPLHKRHQAQFNLDTSTTARHMTDLFIPDELIQRVTDCTNNYTLKGLPKSQWEEKAEDEPDVDVPATAS